MQEAGAWPASRESLWYVRGCGQKESYRLAAWARGKVLSASSSSSLECRRFCIWSLERADDGGGEQRRQVLCVGGKERLPARSSRYGCRRAKAACWELCIAASSLIRRCRTRAGCCVSGALMPLSPSCDGQYLWVSEDLLISP